MATLSAQSSHSPCLTKHTHQTHQTINHENLNTMNNSTLTDGHLNRRSEGIGNPIKVDCHLLAETSAGRGFLCERIPLKNMALIIKTFLRSKRHRLDRRCAAVRATKNSAARRRLSVVPGRAGPAARRVRGHFDSDSDSEYAEIRVRASSDLDASDCRSPARACHCASACGSAAWSRGQPARPDTPRAWLLSDRPGPPSR
jgi:hypothetical protein